MIASIPWLQSALNFFLNRILICQGCCQTFELFHSFKGSIINLYIVTSPCILILRHDSVLFGLSTLLWFGSCNHCILASSLWSKNCEHSSSNHGLFCFNSYRPRLSLAEVLIFSLMFSQTLFMSLLSYKFCKDANLFEILMWYCFLTSSFLRLNLSMSNLCAPCLLTASLSLTSFTPTTSKVFLTYSLAIVIVMLPMQAPHIPFTKSHVHFPLLSLYQRISPNPRQL